jgi:hypothetical protein
MTGIIALVTYLTGMFFGFNLRKILGDRFDKKVK